MAMTESPTSDRATLIASAVRRWVSDLTDLGRRNTLLYYKDLRSGTLDLSHAEPAALERLLAARPVRLSRLFTEPAERADAVRRARTIHRKIREMAEERGINAGFLATGMARWEDPASEAVTRPAAPILLRAVTLAPTRARYDDFELVLDEETEINPVLLHKLNTEFGAGIEAEPLRTLVPSGPFDPLPVYERLGKLARAAEIPGFAVDDRQVLGTFTYAKLPMVRDLRAAEGLLAQNPVVAAVAGDPRAQVALGADRDADLGGHDAELGKGPGPGPEGHGPGTSTRAAPGATGATGPTGDRPDGSEPDDDEPPPQHDLSVLDADSSQLAAVRAVQHGRSLVVHGPPGTGKSQTIANLIATLVAGGWRVLFVAEKRAAIDAVLGRLKGADLGDLVLDIHDGTRDRRRIARDLGATLERARQTPPPEVDWLHRRLAGRRRLLTRHVRALHERRQPWNVTAFEVQAALLGVPETARTAVRFRGPALRRLDAETADGLRDELREYAHAGGFDRDANPWHGAAIDTPEQAGQAHETATRLSATILPEARGWLDRAVAETGVRPPRTLPEWRALVELFTGVRATLDRFGPEVWGDDGGRRLAAMVAATGPRAARAAQGVKMSWRTRRELVKQARARCRTGRPRRAELHRGLVAAQRQLRDWPGEAPPRAPACLDQTARSHAALVTALDPLRPAVPALAPEWLGALERTLGALAADHVTPWRLPRTRTLRRRFGELGLEPLVDELTRRAATPDAAVHAFDHAWFSSILDQLRVDDSAYAGLPGGTLDEIARDFRSCDTQHLLTNRARVRRATAERLRDVQDRFPAQAQLIRKQAALRRRHLPLRRLLEQAADVLFALKPCWAMSPLMASQVLPVRRLFDVVIFDEASQVIPADAIPAIMRAGQVVVAGDSHQLPPTNFFRQICDDADEDDEPPDLGPDRRPRDPGGAADRDAGRADRQEYLDPDPAGDHRPGQPAAGGTGVGGTGVVSFETGFESILETLEPLLPSRRLEWHYRSRDERLVAFSNARIYDSSLTTFPGVFAGDCLRHVAVDQVRVEAPPEDREPALEPDADPGPGRVSKRGTSRGAASGSEQSVTAEVDRVVELILEHARTRPDESLGVIAMGAPHANRVDAALRAALAGHPGLEAFFADDADEPFFVKNLERVQGDERDAIILTIGYGKRADGQMRYAWGPLLRAGGERRLNVAITRAKRRLTLVSSFSGRDVDASRVTSEGARLLCDYLEFAESGGSRIGRSAPEPRELSPFERDVCTRLTAAGVPVVPRYGIGGYRVDFAAAHPARPDRMVLAVETDGPSYHGSASARDRDRLRQEHLERLGWEFHRIWSTNWFLDPSAETAKVRAAYERAVTAMDAADAAARAIADAAHEAAPGPAPGLPPGPEAARTGAGAGTANSRRSAAGTSARPASTGSPPGTAARPGGAAAGTGPAGLDGSPGVSIGRDGSPAVPAGRGGSGEYGHGGPGHGKGAVAGEPDELGPVGRLGARLGLSRRRRRREEPGAAPAAGAGGTGGAGTAETPQRRTGQPRDQVTGRRDPEADRNTGSAGQDAPAGRGGSPRGRNANPAGEHGRSVPAASGPVHRRLPRPPVRPGLPIAEYTHDELVRVARWVESDRLLRTEDETLTEVMSTLGFKRRGTRIVAAISAAIATARATPQGPREP